MPAYEIIPVEPDTVQWEEERRESLGASEIPAVLGLSPWSTPLDVYRSKLGVDREFDEVLGYIGHASELIIAGWVEQYSDQRGVKLEPAFMARSAQWPWLHASFDRVSHDGAGELVTWQFKTAHQYGGHHWDEGVPTDVRVQVQGEIAVGGTPGAWVVVWIGGREFRLFWEPRDEAFITDYLIPQTRDFWERVKNRDAPDPSTAAEINEAFPSEAGTSIVASDSALEAAERRAVLLSDIAAQKAEADALTLVLGNYMGTAETLKTGAGQKVLTFKTQQGRRNANLTKLTLDYPDVAAEVISQGAPFKVMRHAKEKS